MRLTFRTLTLSCLPLSLVGGCVGDGSKDDENCDDTAISPGPGTTSADTGKIPTDDTGCDTGDAPCPGATTPFFVTRSATDANRLDLYWSNGDGTFTGPEVVGEDLGEPWVGVLIGDFDGDDAYEILGRQESLGMMYLMQYDCEGQTWATERIGEGVFTAYGAGDLDNNGSLDLYGWEGAFEDGTPKPYTALNDGTASFTVKANTFDLSGTDSYRGHASYQARDVNGDGCRDMAVVSYADQGSAGGRLFLHEGQCDGSFAVAGSSPITLPMPTNSSDLGMIGAGGGDGYADLLTGLDDDGDPGAAFQLDGGTSGLSSTANEVFDANPSVESGSGCCAGHLRLYDWDGDEDLDALVNYAGDSNGWDDWGIGLWIYDDGAFVSTPSTVVSHGSVASRTLAVPIELGP